MKLSKLLSPVIAALAAIAVAPALAVDGPNDPFELDGNIVDDSGAAGKDDWLNLVGASVTTTVPVVDAVDGTIFGGGDKDIQDLPALSYTDGSSPDKDDIFNAAAAAYDVNGDLVIYFAADRYATAGDAYIGAWFFADEVELDGAGGFTGNKTEGDILVLANFTNGGTIANIEVLEWNPGDCPTKDPGNAANFGPGDCPADNLKILFKQAALCNDTTKDACAIANAGGEAAFAGYASKGSNLPPGFYPALSFFEGGANITNLLGESRCFASFMIETRSAASETAQLKDFVLGSFPLCRVELSKTCSDSGNVFDANLGGIPVPWTVTLTNEGFSPISSATLTDNSCTPADTSDDVTTTLAALLAAVNDADGQLGQGESVSWSESCLITAANYSTTIRNGASAVAEGGDVPVLLDDSCTQFPEEYPGVCFDACAIDTSPSLAVQKFCTTRLDSSGGTVTVVVDFNGYVTNDSNTADPGEVPTPTPLTNVTVEELSPTTGPLVLYGSALDAAAGTNPLATPVSLDPGETAYFAGSYVPTAPDDPEAECASDANFTDVVNAEAQDSFTGAATSQTGDATCNLCTNCSSPSPSD